MIPKVKNTISLMFVVLTLLNCSRPNQDTNRQNKTPVTATQSIEPSPAAPQQIDGAAIFAEHCASCHGDKGDGIKKGTKLTSGHALNHSFGDYIDQVNDGTEKEMPAFKGTLSDKEITAVVSHVRNTLQAGISPK
jgi:mono/diheme cytochrome c family protein